MNEHVEDGSRFSRRAFISALAVGGVGMTAFGADPASTDEALRDVLLRAAIGPLQTTATSHYLVGSDESEEVRLRVARQFETLSADAWKSLRILRPALKPPARKLRVLFLGDPKKYERLARVRDFNPTIKGYYAYDLATIFLSNNDRTGDAEMDRTNAAWGHRHEGVHQITYECGMLNPRGNRPSCIVEGLALLGEPESPAEAVPFLRRHPRYIEWLIQFPVKDRPSLADLFRDDGWPHRFDDLHGRDAGYALSWLLAHLLMSDAKLRPRLDTYLVAIFPRTDGSHRLADAEVHFGELSDLEVKMDRHLDDLASRPTGGFGPSRRRLARP